MRGRSLIVLSFLFSFPASGQLNEKGDSLMSRRWYVPDGFVATYAGGVGLVSTGVLYKISKRTEATITVGYTPPKFGNIWTTNLYTSYSLVRLNFSPQIEIRLKAGAFLNYNIGKNIYLKWPEQFHKYYYWWNSALRYGPFVNLEGTHIPVSGKWNYTLFLHCNTNDLYLATYRYSYNAISFSDILVLGVGIRMDIKNP